MSLVTDPTLYWAVLARSRGEVLAAEAEAGGVHVGVLGMPGGLTQQETEAWLAEVIGVARESATANAAAGPIPALLHHAMTGLLFSHTELWGRAGSPEACSFVFAQVADEVGFGWVGDAEVLVWVDGEPCAPTWVTVRDESGVEGRAWRVGSDHTVQVKLVWNVPRHDASNGGDIEAVWTAATLSHASTIMSSRAASPLVLDAPSPQAAPTPQVVPAPPIAPATVAAAAEAIADDEPADELAAIPSDQADEPAENLAAIGAGDDVAVTAVAQGTESDHQPATDDPEPGDVETRDESPSASAPEVVTAAGEPAAIEESAESEAPALASDAEPHAAERKASSGGFGTWLRKGLSWLKHASQEPLEEAQTRAVEPATASESVDESAMASERVDEQVHVSDEVLADVPAAMAMPPSEPAATAVTPEAPVEPASTPAPVRLTRTDDVFPDLIPPTPESPAITERAVPVSPRPGMTGAAPPVWRGARGRVAARPDPTPAVEPAANPNDPHLIQLPAEPEGAIAHTDPPGLAAELAAPRGKKKGRGEKPGDPHRETPPSAPSQRSTPIVARNAAPPAPAASIATPVAVPTPPASITPPVPHAAPAATGPPSTVLPPTVTPPLSSPIEAKTPTLAPATAPQTPAPAPESAEVLDDPAIAGPEVDVTPAAEPVANTPALTPIAPAAEPAAPQTPPAIDIPREDDSLETFESDPAIADAPLEVPHDPAIADVPAVVSTPTAPAVASRPKPAVAPQVEPKSTRHASARGAGPRRPAWPSKQELLSPHQPVWRRPWVIVAAVMALFAGGWLVGALQESGHTKASDGSGALGGALQAIGLGGPRFTVNAISRPPGAWISVDGKALTLRTPAALSLSPGEHTVRLSFPDMGSADYTVRGLKGDRMPLEATLWGALEVFSPNEVGVISVTVDGVQRGTAPMRVDSLSPGVHEVRFSAPGAAPWGQTIDVHVGQTREMLARANPSPAMGVLQIQATLTDEQGTQPLKGGQVYIDGELRGVAPLTLELPRGPHSVRLMHKGVQAPIQVIDLPGGNQRFAVFELGLDRDWPRLVVEPPRVQRDRPAVVSVSLSGIAPGELRGMWLHAQAGTGTWRRYDMTLLKAPGGVVGVAVFPMSAFDGRGLARYYASAGFAAGDEAFTELRTLQLEKPADR